LAEFTHLDLRRERESRKIQRWKLAEALGVSEWTVERWEKGEVIPDPDDVGRIEEFLGATGIWERWMRSQYDSYRKRHPEKAPEYDLARSMVRVRYELGDVLALHDKAERDALDGSIDEPGLQEKYKKELEEVIAAARDVLEKL